MALASITMLVVSLQFFGSSTESLSGAALYDALLTNSRSAAAPQFNFNSRVIIQQGPARSATTLQFQILCLVMAIVQPDEEIQCVYRGEGMRRTVGRANLPMVFKIHDDIATFDPVVNFTNGSHTAQDLGAWYFTTHRDARSEPADVARVRADTARVTGKNVKYVQTTSRLGGLGHHIVRDYRPFFNLTLQQVEYLEEYFRYWIPLRQCCGLQMSIRWLAVIMNSSIVAKPMSSPAYPACEIYKITPLEKQLMRTRAYELYSHKSLQLKSPSNADGKFTGNYCQSITNDLVAGKVAHHFAFKLQPPN